jgi:hypothetical protein
METTKAKKGTAVVETVTYKGIVFRRYPLAKSRNHRVYFAAPGRERRRGVDWLHRQVWKDHFGPIPEGHQVHHKDEDPLNNDPGNLECLTDAEHKRRHAELGTFSYEAVRANLDRIRPLASAWHGSDEGREWHKELGRKSWEGRETVEKVCGYCGETYATKHTGVSRYCSRRCGQAARPRKPPDGPEKVCPECGGKFRVKEKRREATCCSRACGVRYRYRQQKAVGVS